MRIITRMGYLAAGIIGFTFAFTACEDDPSTSTSDTTVTDSAQYTVGVSVDEGSYLVISKDLVNDTISIVGNGFESSSHGSLTYGKDGYIYFLNSNEATIDQFAVSESGLTKISSISTNAINDGATYRYIQVTEDNDLLVLNMPNSACKAPYIVISVPDFTVETYGYIEMPVIASDTALWINAVVSGNKVYLGTLYGEYGTYFEGCPDSLITVVYDYPSFTNPEILINDVTGGSVAGYRTNGSFIDENGDIYQYNLNANAWNATSSSNTSPDGFVRITNGAYDKDYFFNITEQFSEPVAIWNAWYAGNGIAYANIVSDTITVWRGWENDYNQLVMVDLYNKTITKLNIPTANFAGIFQLTAADDEYFYIPVCPSTGDANIYQIKIGGGANDFTKGAKLDGSNAYVNSLIRNY